MDEHRDITLFKYADNSTVLVTIFRDLSDKSEIALSKFMDGQILTACIVTPENAEN